MTYVNSPKPGDRYRHFDVAIYARAYEVQEMADLDWLRSRYTTMSRYVKVNKIYLETHRDTLIPDAATIEGACAFFAEQGVQTAGGITYTVDERNRFETYCYTRPDHRRKVQEIAEYTARFFDEMILDDFFFTSCKCPQCIEAKGARSWTEFRLALMVDAARDLVIGPAKAVNPNVKVVIKYPNWYEHFHGLGFNLELEPALFDGLYTGTETRDPIYSNQHLQPYHGYLIFRYFENLKPGGNGGGWVDTGGMRYADRYAEQLWLTLFAKAPEVTLFDFRQLQWPLQPTHRAPWQDLEDRGGIGFDFDAMIAPVRREDGTWTEDATAAVAAGHALSTVDGLLGELGEPVAVKAYRPHHATGEDFLPSYLGMLGIPIDLCPEFPQGQGTLLLTESAKRDPDLVAKIKAHLLGGSNVVVTSGLYRALQAQASLQEGLRIEDIVELEVTEQKARVSNYLVGWRQVSHGHAEILIPHIRYLTNDSWELVSGLTETTGHPILHYAGYAGAHFYVLTIPDNFDDLYKLPEEVLAHIRAVVMRDLAIRVDGPPQVMLFVYDNDTCIVHSFRDEVSEIRLVLKEGPSLVCDVVTGEMLSGEEVLDWRKQPTGERVYMTSIGPHAYRVFRWS